MSPLKGRQNGPTDDEQKRVKPHRSDGAVAREEDDTKGSCENNGGKRTASEAVMASLPKQGAKG